MDQKNKDFQLILQNLTKKFGKHIAVNDFSFEIKQGDCIGLIGPNGAGKTTLLRMLSGILQPTSGSVLFNQVEIEKHRDKIGYLPQFPQFYDWMCAEEVLRFSASLFKMKHVEVERRIPEVLELVGLSGVEKRRVADFSGGMRQRLGIAQAIIHRPQVVILDEPVSALDPVGRREVLNLIEKIKHETTVIFSTHILKDAEEVCNRFCVLNKSRKVEEFYYRDIQARHVQNTLTIQVEQLDKGWLSYLQTLPEIEVTVSDDTLHLTTKKVEVAWQYQVLASIVDYQVAFLAIEIGQFTLEEYFMQLVGEVHA